MKKTTLVDMDMNGTVNKVILIGRLGDDIKMHYFEGGNCIGRFPLATNDGYTNRTTNEKVVNTEWHNIVMRNKAAETVEKYLSKGDRIYIEGKMKTRQWQAEDGSTRYSTEVHVNEFTFLETKESSASSSSASVSKNKTNLSDNPTTTSKKEQEDEDILPF